MCTPKLFGEITFSIFKSCRGYELRQTESHMRCDNVFVYVCTRAWSRCEIKMLKHKNKTLIVLCILIILHHVHSMRTTLEASATLCLSKRRRRSKEEKNRTNLLIKLDWTLTKQNAKASHVPNFPALTTNHLFSFEFDHSCWYRLFHTFVRQTSQHQPS